MRHVCVLLAAPFNFLSVGVGVRRRNSARRPERDHHLSLFCSFASNQQFGLQRKSRRSPLVFSGVAGGGGQSCKLVRTIRLLKEFCYPNLTFPAVGNAYICTLPKCKAEKQEPTYSSAVTMSVQERRDTDIEVLQSENESLRAENDRMRKQLQRQSAEIKHLLSEQTDDGTAESNNDQLLQSARSRGRSRLGATKSNYFGGIRSRKAHSQVIGCSSALRTSWQHKVDRQATSSTT
jgi:hypothetical protein